VSERAAKPKVYKREDHWYIETPGYEPVQCVSWKQGMERVRMWHQYNAAALRNQWYGDWYASHYEKQWRGSW
jgi:hypothetical protein